MSRKTIAVLPFGVRVMHDKEWQEYQVCIAGYDDADYYTDDLTDALETAKVISAQRSSDNLATGA